MNLFDQTQIDAIYAWEASPIAASTFWKSVPKQFIGKLVYHNVPVSSQIDDAHNPFTVVKRIAKQHDYVTFKLDIDTPSVEQPLFKQLANDKELLSLIDEFIYEDHTKNVALAPSWGMYIMCLSQGCKSD